MNIHVTINTATAEHERTCKEVKSIDNMMDRLREEFPEAESFVLAFCA